MSEVVELCINAMSNLKAYGMNGINIAINNM